MPAELEGLFQADDFAPAGFGAPESFFAPGWREGGGPPAADDPDDDGPFRAVSPAFDAEEPRFRARGAPDAASGGAEETQGGELQEAEPAHAAPEPGSLARWDALREQDARTVYGVGLEELRGVAVEDRFDMAEDFFRRRRLLYFVGARYRRYRRDNAQLLPKLQRAFLEHLVVQGDADAALRSVHSTVRQLVAGEVDIKDFIISKKYAKTTYKTPQIHVQLNSRIARRSPGEEYVIGDRIPYVVIKDGGKPLYERGEDPKYAKTHNLPLDVDYYFSKQIEQPMVRLIAPLVGARACDNFFQRALKQNQQYVFMNKSPVITIYLSSTI